MSKKYPQLDAPMVAVIPVREGSTRIKNKNFLPFGKSKSLVHHKIEQLKKADCFDEIFISSDSSKAREIAEEMEVSFAPRSSYMCSSTPRWNEVITHIMESLPGDPHVAWTLATGPHFENYPDAIAKYVHGLGEYDSLVGVKKIQEYLVDEKCRPLFYSFGPWHPYTPEIKPIYAINDALFVAKKSLQIKLGYWVGVKPNLYECDAIESIDINFPEDLEMALLAQEQKERQ